MKGPDQQVRASLRQAFMRRRNVALLYAIVHQRIDFVGFVKNRIDP